MFFIVWKVIYGAFLYDSQYVDQFLTNHVGEASVIVLNNSGLFSGFTAKNEIHNDMYAGEMVENRASAIYHNDKLVLYIANACNGLELLVLYIGFIVCMPSRFWRKVLYIILGVIILDIIMAGLIFSLFGDVFLLFSGSDVYFFLPQPLYSG
ncbi:MAG: hypothetical protein B7Z06_11210 [Flavobacteriales bacterium 32-35-8]|nr:MAG: hypothetical protein B7Z06_11210 [Flavobacteriales bacterium 32-35-8]